MTDEDESTAERLACTALAMAGLAEETATLLEAAAKRGDARRRLATAAWEREVAAVHRANATRLRSDRRPLELEQLPHAPVL